MKYLNDSVISTIENFNLKARLIVEGFIIGLHKSPYHGFSVEFSDHRQYNQGDPLNKIDWKVYARTSKYFIKRYEEETNLKSYILIDHSASMGYSSYKNNVTKLDYAKMLSASLSYLLIKQQDAVGLLPFTDKITEFLPASSVRTYLNLIFSKIYNLNAENRTNTSEILHNLAHRISKRGLIILISDLIDEPERIIQGLLHFRYNKHEVIVFHLYDEKEKKFDFKKETEFIDSETGEKIVVNPWQVKKEYIKQYENNLKKIKNKCLEFQIEYNEINTSTPIEELLMKYLIKRSKLY